ncbi:MAG TPA: hypothetical protein DHV48_03730 [Prolixibacteraceae bacterium]|nr:hypothetical protein [Prolixibacteraceae bacterium]
MKAKRVDCCNCHNFQAEGEQKKFKYSCKLGKRVMFRAPVGYWYFTNDFLFPRYCNEFKQIEYV